MMNIFIYYYYYFCIMKKTLSLALVAVVWLWAAASSFAFFPQGGQDLPWVAKGVWVKAMGMFGMLDNGWWNDFGGRWGKGMWWAHGAMFGTAVQTAIANKDYDAFVASWNEAQSKITAPTAEEFGKQVTMEKARKAVEDAITAENYEAFKTALSNLPTPNNGSWAVVKTPTIPTKEQFDAMILKKKSHEAMKTAVESNDYNAFVAARTSSKPTVPSKDEFTQITEKMSNGTTTGKKGAKINGKRRIGLKTTTQN